jgi:hypothetical protein
MAITQGRRRGIMYSGNLEKEDLNVLVAYADSVVRA